MPVLIEIFEVFRMQGEHHHERDDPKGHGHHSGQHDVVLVEDQSVNRIPEAKERNERGEHRHHDPQFAVHHDELRYGAGSAVANRSCQQRPLPGARRKCALTFIMAPAPVNSRRS